MHVFVICCTKNGMTFRISGLSVISSDMVGNKINDYLQPGFVSSLYKRFEFGHSL